jgi:hypothetical protein
MRTKILILISLLFVALIVVIVTRPATFSVTRSIVSSAPPAVVFPHLNDFRKWEEWSPWAKLDPNATTVFEGPETGTGAIFKWSGNDEVGEGRQEIVESRANEVVRIRLDFIKPFAGTNESEFSLKPEGTGTQVTWTMSGQNHFMSKAFSLIIDCEKMIGHQFEEGLANLKRVSEATGNF